jgi:hypothetical protein
MDNFTKEEKDEIRKKTLSKELKEDFQFLSRNRVEFRKKDGSFDIDRTFKWLNDINILFNHPKKPFKKITGNNFKM